MPDQHPITPPPELIKEWVAESNHNEPLFPQVAIRAAQWGADQELDKCCDWLGIRNLTDKSVAPCLLRNARRPKPPSLKEQALEQLRNLDQHGALDCNTDKIRRALEQLDD